MLHRKKTGGKKPKKMPEAAAVVKAGAPASKPPTPLQLLNAECQRRRVALHDNTFVAGHCFFEAFGVSSNITLAFGEGNGAVFIRHSIAFGYEHFNELRLPLAPRIDDMDRRRALGYDKDEADEADAATADVFSFAAGSSKAFWQPLWAARRAAQMREINCNIETNDLAEYNIETDVFVLSIVWLRPVSVLAKVLDGHGHHESTVITSYRFIPIDVNYIGGYTGEKGDACVCGPLFDNEVSPAAREAKSREQFEDISGYFTACQHIETTLLQKLAAWRCAPGEPPLRQHWSARGVLSVCYPEFSAF